VLGGEYRAESHITVGSVAFCGAIAVSADSAVLGVGGINTGRYFCRVATGCNDDGKHDRRCSQNLVLADSAKFNHKLLGHIASLEQIDILVTDAEPPRELFGALEQLEVQVLVAPPLNSQPPPQAYDSIYLANVFARLDALTTTWGCDG
jgi:DeoR/GlpR family transcriptional regulator of sugar metabolism